MGTLVSKAERGAAWFTQPLRQIIIMLAVLVMVLAGAWLILPVAETVFFANPWLNGTIVAVFVIGVVACFWQVIQIMVSVAWIGDFVEQPPGFDYTSAPSLLAPLAALLHSRGAGSQISSTSGRSILDSVATRIDEARDIARYLANLLIFLGLLGTFFGLATTIPGVVETIRNLTPQQGETAVEMFTKLMSSLETQLDGLGTAFSSSLLGLSGSLVIGLLELFAGHGQNRFYRELEEWLSSITRIGLAAGDGEGGDAGALVQVLDQMVTRLEAQEARAAEDRAGIIAGLGGMARALDGLAARDSGVAALERIAEGQGQVIAGQIRTAEAQERILAALDEEASLGADAEARMRLRSIDVQLLRLLEELSAGRQESTADLRADIGALTQAVRQLSRLQGGR